MVNKQIINTEYKIQWMMKQGSHSNVRYRQKTGFFHDFLGLEKDKFGTILLPFPFGP